MELTQILKELKFLGIVLATYSIAGVLLVFFVEAAQPEHVVQLGVVVILVIYIIRIIFNIMHKLK